MNFQSRQDDLLFFKADINAVTDAQQRNMGGEIQGLDPDRLLNTPVDDLVAYFAQKYRIEVPTLHRDRALLDEPRETYQEVNDYGRRDSNPIDPDQAHGSVRRGKGHVLRPAVDVRHGAPACAGDQRWGRAGVGDPQLRAGPGQETP